MLKNNPGYGGILLEQTTVLYVNAYAFSQYDIVAF